MRIKDKLRLIIVLTAAIGVMVVALLTMLYIQDRRVTQSEEAFHQVATAVFELTLLSNDVLLHPDEKRARRQWRRKHQHIGVLLGKVPPVEERIRSAIERMRGHHRSLGKVFLRLIAAVDQAGTEKTLRSQQSERLIGQLAVKAQALVAESAALASIIRLEQDQQRIRLGLIIIAMVILVALFLALLTRLVAQSVLQPILRLKEGTERIGAGDLEYRVGNPIRDEIGDLARSFDSMTQRLKQVTASGEALRDEIEARKRAEAREARFGRVLNSSSNEIYMFDADSLRFQDVNLGARNNLGYTLDELQALGPLDLKPGYTPESFAELLDPLRREEKNSIVFETYHRRKDGTTYPVEERLQLLKQESQPVFIAVIQDITERNRADHALKQATERLKASNKDLQDFAYVVSHDLREPLRMVSSYMQLLVRRYGEKLGKDADEFIGFAVDGANRMSSMIDGLLQYSRVETQGEPLQPVQAEQALDGALADLGLVIEACGAQINRQPMPEVMADPSQLERLLQNLIGNALKFQGQAEPVIEIGVQPQGAFWRFSVRDNGIGIEPRHREHIFNMFQRLHGRDEYPGLGIGLAVCKRIVERHGGRIWVDANPGKGSTFNFILPALPEESQEAMVDE
ncbi:MAG: PAS domain S-box protein [Candidatus Thiodiazotropha sp. (ex Dulcina madagascariensis)]|nr:PAS domain S-box protein [Candidatus Thiodiazotropha sp. (ex Dulcina madagascariensis)]MCU7924875.1 PAS domain S-box protein [Candidatus Thiodiazotropha sp. (ex Dulcina madagascariensis)]